uniref:PIR Superfamily Protein n=1 Tax=Parastrongyloides trichosuri TaxID=131310 RepID=A0A0N4Z817_PARTI
MIGPRDVQSVTCRAGVTRCVRLTPAYTHESPIIYCDEQNICSRLINLQYMSRGDLKKFYENYRDSIKNMFNRLDNEKKITKEIKNKVVNKLDEWKKAKYDRYNSICCNSRNCNYY